MRQEEGKIKLKGDKVKTSWEEWLGASGRGENVWLVSKMRDRNEGNESPLGRDNIAEGCSIWNDVTEESVLAADL